MFKKVLLLSLGIILIISSIYVVYGGVFDDTTITSVSSPDVEKTSKQFFGAIIDVVQTFAVGLAIIMIIVHAMRYMSSAPAEKGEFKKELTHYTIGAVIIFAASGIVEIVQQFFTDSLKEAGGGL